MKRIDDDIASGQFKNLYLIYGEEEYLKRQYKKKLVSALVNDGDNMNFTKYEGGNVSIPQVIDQAETMPFFAEHRVILMEDLGFAKKSPEDLCDYLNEIAEATVFIIIEKEIDKRSKLYKIAQKVGRDIEIKMPDERTLAIWIRSKLKNSQKQMTESAWREFLSRTDGSMDNMELELEKLVSYVGTKNQIELEDVEAVCIAQVETKIFDMIDAITSKNTAKLMDLYHDMLSAKEPPMRILYMIVKQYRLIKAIKELDKHGDNPSTIASKLGSRDFIIKKNLKLARDLSIHEINGLLADAATNEQLCKTGKMDENMACELIMMKYSK